jgi:hypothetical protein
MPPLAKNRKVLSGRSEAVQRTLIRKMNICDNKVKGETSGGQRAQTRHRNLKQNRYAGHKHFQERPNQRIKGEPPPWNCRGCCDCIEHGFFIFRRKKIRDVNFVGMRGLVRESLLLSASRACKPIGAHKATTAGSGSHPGRIMRFILGCGNMTPGAICAPCARHYNYGLRRVVAGQRALGR